MPNAFIKPSVIAAAALGLLQRELVIPGLVWTDALGNSPLGLNDTFSIRIPATTAARTRTLRGTGSARNITLDTLTETKIDVTLDTDIYNAIAVTDEELTLDIRDFGAQILAPQTRAIAEGLENGLVSKMQTVAPAATVAIDPTKTYNGFVDARKALNDANVPLSQRAVVIGSGIEAAVLKDPQFVHVDQSGSDSALRDAMIGRIAGFDVYVSNALGQDEGYAFHKTAYIMTMRAPVIPDGASFGASQAYQGLAMRWIRDYDFSTVQDRSLVDTFVGYATTPDTVNGSSSFVRSVRLELATATIAVSPTTKTLAVAGKQQLTVTDDSGRTIPTTLVTFTTSDATKATVSANGNITGVATGSATITATYQGRTATCAVTVS